MLYGRYRSIPTQKQSKQRSNRARSLLAKCPVARAPPSLDFGSVVQNLVVNLWKQLVDMVVEAGSPEGVSEPFIRKPITEWRSEKHPQHKQMLSAGEQMASENPEAQNDHTDD